VTAISFSGAASMPWTASRAALTVSKASRDEERDGLMAEAHPTQR
jgi:hypothetical protein